MPARNPPSAGDAFAAAIALHQQGRLAEAEAIYRGLLRADPGHAGALHLLGLAHFQRGDATAAARLIGESVGRDGRNAVVHNNLGAVLLALRRLDEALAAFDRATALKPDYAEALNNAGNALVSLGRPQEALERYERAVGLGPPGATLLYNRAIALQQLGRLDEALAGYDAALALEPRYADALANRGEALRLLGRASEAIACFDQAVALAPGNAVAFNGRGAALLEAGRMDEALASFDRAAALDPAGADAHANRANLLVRQERHEEALASCERALAASPAHALALRSRMAALLALHRHEETVACADALIARDEGEADAHFARALALVELFRREEALPSLERALALSPDLPYAPGLRLHLRMHLCEWEGHAADCARLVEATLAGRKACPPFAFLAIPASPKAQLESARAWVEDRYPASASPLWRGEAYAHDRIRVGYFSADFHDHATAHLMAGVLERHDRSAFEVTAISFGPAKEDAWRSRIRAGVERFVDATEWGDARIASLARELELDIAVDLKGHTAGARAGVFARRPAPVQASFLGYPGTLGASYVDYVIADAVVVPAGHEPFYTEKLVLLPDCYQPNDSGRRISAHAPSRAQEGLPEPGFVFCCFNNSYKITPEAFETWMRLLGRVPGSVLWLLGTSRTAQDNLRRAAQARGISPGRLVFAGVVDPAEHLARHRLADLFLDTFEYNAHTTASDALWAGLPLVTVMGGTFASRVAASLLGAVGLPELVATTREAYEAMALDLATSPEKLAAVRAKLAANRDTQPLFDTPRFTRNLETAFSLMHGRRRQGLPPARLVVPPRTR